MKPPISMMDVFTLIPWSSNMSLNIMAYIYVILVSKYIYSLILNALEVHPNTFLGTQIK